eukprot:c23976_g1_i2 orf=444-3443(-)
MFEEFSRNVGYELSRSLTTRRRNEDTLVRKSMSSVDSMLLKPKLLDRGNSEADHKSRTPSVVARLMGLDPLPHHEEVQSFQSSSHPSSRRLLPHEFVMSQSGPFITKQASVSRVPSQRSTTFVEESIPERPRIYGELPFRNHPQEKQLQEFKKEFTARQGKHSAPCSKVDMLAVHEEALQKDKEGFDRESLNESQEFLDALDFLHSNKDFFAKVLKEPGSLFATHLQQRGGGLSTANKEGLGQKGRRLTRSFSESKKESYICLPVAHDLTDSRKKHEMQQIESDDKVCFPQFGQEECMPAQSCRYTRSVSFPLKTEYEQTIPTKIVVLKPKLGKNAGSRPSSPLSPLSQLDGSFKARVEIKERAKQDIKERLLGRNESAMAKEPSRNLSKDGLKDDGDIARQILKHVKEDMSRRLSSENSQVSSSRGKRSPAQRVSVLGDTSGASDGEGYCSSSRRVSRDSVKVNVSLPSSPRLSRSDAEDDDRPFGGNRRKGVIVEKKSSRVAASTNNSRDTRKYHVGAGGFTDLGRKQDGNRDSRSVTTSRAGGSKGIKDTSESSKVLARSVSSPASAGTVENRALEHEQKGRLPIHRSACLNNARAADNSLFRGRLSSLKDSFSLSKKKSGKKQSSMHSSSPSEMPEICSPRQLAEEHEGIPCVDAKESCAKISSVYAWQTCSMQDDKDKAVMGGCLDDVISMNSAASSGLHQWASTADLLDSASDVSSEKFEQPSPVSVLETPFQEESPSPEDRRATISEASLGFSPLDVDYKKRLLDLQGSFLSSSTSRQNSFNSITEEASFECNGANQSFEMLSMCDIACPPGAEEELVYIRDLLAFTGFNNNEVIRTHAFSAEHGLNPNIFQRLESYYEKMSKKNTSSRRGDYSTPLNFLTRRMLFDVVDEILSWKLREPNFKLGPRQAKASVHVLYTGKQVLEHVWVHLRDNCYMPCDSEEEGLDGLASKDLMKDVGWTHSQADMQAVAMELERLICGDLIREVVHEYVRV